MLWNLWCGIVKGYMCCLWLCVCICSKLCLCSFEYKYYLKLIGVFERLCNLNLLIDFGIFFKINNNIDKNRKDNEV